MQSTKYKMTDVLGQALLDYQSGSYDQDIITYSSLDEKDILSLPYLFRNFEAMPALEQKALELCKGSILDIGCGAGSHALFLQQKGMDVTGMDKSPGAIETCKLRGLKKTMYGNIMNISGMKFDTLLLLMNGIGLAGNLSRLDHFLIQLKSLLKPGGQVLLDSSDIIYMFDAVGEESKDLEMKGHKIENYYGNVTFSMEYKGLKGELFEWLYLDYNTLIKAAGRNNLSCELVMKGTHYDYLARLSTST